MNPTVLANTLDAMISDRAEDGITVTGFWLGRYELYAFDELAKIHEGATARPRTWRLLVVEGWHFREGGIVPKVNAK